jgi:hypothetical protein
MPFWKFFNPSITMHYWIKFHVLLSIIYLSLFLLKITFKLVNIPIMHMISTHLNDLFCMCFNIILLINCFYFFKFSTLAKKVITYHLVYGICKNGTLTLLHIIKIVRNTLQYADEEKIFNQLKELDPGIYCFIVVI